MALFQWAATASQGAWTTAIAASGFNALANNSMALGSAIDNTTTVDEWMEVSFIAASVAMTAGAHIAIYILPLLDDGSSYPTNSAAGASLPAITYCRGVIGMPTATAIPAGSVVVPIPYGTFKIGAVNRLGVATSASATANTLRYRLIVDAVA